jgi:hypothetical protein
MTICPKGHPSASSDYCDDCGAPMGATSRPIGSATCPHCSTPRAQGTRFCELCQHAFDASPASDVTPSRLMRSDQLARAALMSISKPVPQPDSKPAEAAFESPLELPLLARIIADPSLCEPDMLDQFPNPAPTPRLFHLDLDENLIGRESASKQSRPEIPLEDPGASRRHAKIVRHQGSFHLLELGSSNGTLVDGEQAVPGVPIPLKAGSRLRIGMWTLLLIENR